MTRAQVLEQYDVNEDGVIKSPGKFEGEMLYVPYFWQLGLEGCSSFDTGSLYGFEVESDDLQEFPELEGTEFVILGESEQGFVSCETRDSKVDESEFDKEENVESDDEPAY